MDGRHMEHRSPGAGFSRVRFEELSRLVWRRFHLDSPVRFAALVGMLAGLVSVAGLLERGGYAGDFTWAWRAARLWLAGRDPYLDPGLHPIFPYPFDAPLLYPMPAVVIALPFALLPAWMAGTAFFALSAGTLAYVIARTERWHLLPLFLSAPFYVAATVAQWSPLIVAAALAPGLAFLTLAKPNIGLPMLAVYGNREGWKRAALFAVLTVPLLPTWPLGWWHNLRSEPSYPVPLFVFPGALLVLAVLAWRDPGARLLLALACMPQRLWFYDQLPLWLLCRTPQQGTMLAIASWIGYWGWRLSPGQYAWEGSSPATAPIWVVSFLYLPALALVLYSRYRSR
jgi:hypothetical protein